MQLQKAHEDFVTSVAWSRDGRFLLTAGGGGGGQTNQHSWVRLWDVAECVANEEHSAPKYQVRVRFMKSVLVCIRSLGRMGVPLLNAVSSCIPPPPLPPPQFQMMHKPVSAVPNPCHPHLLVCTYSEGGPWAFDLALIAEQAARAADLRAEDGMAEDEGEGAEGEEPGWTQLENWEAPPLAPGAMAPPAPKGRAAPAVGTWSPRGAYILSGSGCSFLALWDARGGVRPSKEPSTGLQLPGGKVLALSIDRSERTALVSTGDGAVRMVAVSVPGAGPGGEFTLQLMREFRVGGSERITFRRVALSHDREWVAGLAESKEDHRVFVFSAPTGRLERLLATDDKVGAGDMAWHPTCNMLATTTLVIANKPDSGKVFFFSPVLYDHWSNFAPDFRELQGNEEYEEGEDEFDLMEGAAREERLREGTLAPAKGLGGAEAAVPDPSTHDGTFIDLMAAREADARDLLFFSSDDEDALTGAGVLHYLPIRVTGKAITADEEPLDVMRAGGAVAGRRATDAVPSTHDDDFLDAPLIRSDEPMPGMSGPFPKRGAGTGVGRRGDSGDADALGDGLAFGRTKRMPKPVRRDDMVTEIGAVPGGSDLVTSSGRLRKPTKKAADMDA